MRRSTGNIVVLEMTIVVTATLKLSLINIIIIISASRLFHGLDPAVAKALSPTFTRPVVILARSA
jgi:hypothetical protein